MVGRLGQVTCEMVPTPFLYLLPFTRAAVAGTKPRLGVRPKGRNQRYGLGVATVEESGVRLFRPRDGEFGPLVWLLAAMLASGNLLDLSSFRKKGRDFLVQLQTCAFRL